MLKGATGQILWSRDLASPKDKVEDGSFVADDEQIYAACSWITMSSLGYRVPEFWITALSVDSGRVRWEKQATESKISELVSSGVWVAWTTYSPQQAVIANAATGKELRRVKRDRSEEASPRIGLRA